MRSLAAQAPPGRDAHAHPRGRVACDPARAAHAPLDGPHMCGPVRAACGPDALAACGEGNPISFLQACAVPWVTLPSMSPALVALRLARQIRRELAAGDR